MATSKRVIVPVVLDPSHPGHRPRSSAAAKYQADLEARTALARDTQKAESPIPDLTAASGQFNPSRDRPMTLAAMGQAQRRLGPQGTEGTPQQAGLRAETVMGLQALAAHNAQHAPQPQPQQPQQPASQQHGPLTHGVASAARQTPPSPPPPSTATRPAPKETRMSEQIATETAPSAPASTTEPSKIKENVSEALSSLDDLEFERLLRGIQNDVINNEKQRESVKKRVKDIDLIAGLANNEFTQEVEIVPGLRVIYRSISAEESSQLRLILYNMTAKDKRLETVAAELLGLLQTVCAVTRLNGTAFPPHMISKTQGGPTEFDENAFTAKYETFRRYPVALIHALGTHGFWFDQRVRELFAHAGEALGNG